MWSARLRQNLIQLLMLYIVSLFIDYTFHIKLLLFRCTNQLFTIALPHLIYLSIMKFTFEGFIYYIKYNQYRTVILCESCESCAPYFYFCSLIFRSYEWIEMNKFDFLSLCRLKLYQLNFSITPEKKILIYFTTE